MQGNLTALLVTVGIILIIVLIGFFAGRNKSVRGSVEEWSVGGRRLGSLLVWFLVGADLYTAYIFLGLTSTAYKGGSIAFFAIPYAILAYLIGYFFLPKLWEVGKEFKFTTLADYVRDRFDSKLLSLLVALDGVLMLIPYIDLQLSGILDTMKFAGAGYINVTVVVITSFLLVALYTFFSGIKAPVYTAIIKDILVWIIMFYLVITIPIIHFGSWGDMISTITNKSPQMLTIPESGPRGIYWFISAAFISALALFMWPHAITGVFTSKSADAIRKNVIFVPLYNLILMFVIFLGIAAQFVLPKETDPRFAFLALIQTSYGGIVQGLSYSTIALASLVPCSIMAIGASNLFASNIYRDFINPSASQKQLTIVTRCMVFVVIGLALMFGLLYPTALVSLQLLGVSGVVQVFPAVVLSLFMRNLSREATIIGFVAGMATVILVTITKNSYGVYEGFWGLAVNFLAVLIVNPIFVRNAQKMQNPVINFLFAKKGQANSEDNLDKVGSNLVKEY